MINSTLGRYRNLFANISNWRQYFVEKKRRGRFVPMEFKTRGNPMSFSVPSKGLYLVFKEIFLTDFYAIRELVLSLPAEPVVIDVGGNAGYFAMMLMSKVPRARIYAYEPIEANHALYSANIARNPSVAGRVTVQHAAVTGTPMESVELFAEADGSSVTASVFAEFDALNAASVRVPAVSLAQILEQNALARVDLLKLDCEGSEYPIIYESPRALWSSVRSLFLEVHDLDAEKRNVGALCGYLEGLGYSSSREVANNGCWAVFARR